MSASDDLGFGARLRNAQDILSFISGFTAYNPPRPHESIAGFQACIHNAILINENMMLHYNAYTKAVAERLHAYKGASGAKKLLSPILSAVQAQYGRSSIEYKTILSFSRRIRSSKRLVLASAGETPASISTSEQSFGSFTYYFSSIVTSLHNFSAYNPSNPVLSLSGLNNLSLQLTQLNNNVAASFHALKDARSQRSSAYADLKDRTQRIKAYARAQYGNSSNEYKLMKAMIV